VQRVVGLDGCRAGWIAISLWLRTNLDISPTSEVSHVEWSLLKGQEDLFDLLQNCHQAWIDVPIGLASSTDVDAPKRACDLAVREALGSKRSSIFTPPIREVLDFDSYHEAMERQYQLIGAKCSIQAWNLMPKIRQMDALWDRLDHADERLLHEAHPEWQFQCWAFAMDASKHHREDQTLRLSDSNPMLASKKTVEGRRQRLAILTSQGFVDATTFYEDCLAQTKRKDVQPDDVLDAMAIAWGSYQAVNGAGRSFPEGTPHRDAKGRPMAIHYAKP
jgi:predicted RNase H-like nuclease